MSAEQFYQMCSECSFFRAGKIGMSFSFLKLFYATSFLLF